MSPSGPDPTDLRSLPRAEASWLAALEDPHVPVRVAWAPTLGYAEVDAEVLAVCERAVERARVARRRGHDDRHRLRRRPGGRLAHPGRGLPTADHAALLRIIRGGTTSTRCCGPSSTVPRRPPAEQVVAGLRPVPRDEPVVGRPVPRRAHPGHADLLRAWRRRSGPPGPAWSTAR